MITPQTKDAVLNYLISIDTGGQFETSYTEISTNANNTKIRFIELILEQFHKIGLLDSYHWGDDTVITSLSADAYDLHYLGGFTAKEEFLKLNLQKLQLEIESIQQTNPSAAERIISTLANITTVAGFFFGK